MAEVVRSVTSFAPAGLQPSPTMCFMAAQLQRHPGSRAGRPYLMSLDSPCARLAAATTPPPLCSSSEVAPACASAIRGELLSLPTRPGPAF